MADKIDSLKIGSTSYDIDLPPDATPSIASLTTSGAITANGGTTTNGLVVKNSTGQTATFTVTNPYEQVGSLSLSGVDYLSASNVEATFFTIKSSAAYITQLGDSDMFLHTYLDQNFVFKTNESGESGRGQATYGVKIPNTYGWTANRTLATMNDIPTVNNGTLTIQGNGTAASTFTANQSGNTTLNIKGSGGTTVTKSANNEITVSTGTIPTVNNGTLTIQKNGTNVQTFTANQSGNVTANITVPTADSGLTNDRYVRYDTASQGLNSTQQSNARTNIGAGTSNLTLGSTSSTAAAGNHLYHYWTANAYYMDSYSTGRNFRMVTESVLADTLRWQAGTVANKEYWDYTNNTWVTSNIDFKNFFDGNYSSAVSIPYAQRKFRFTMNSSTGWPTDALLCLEGSWWDSGAVSKITGTDCYVILTIETRASDSDAWATKVTANFTSTCQYNQSLVVPSTALHTGHTRYRITIELGSWEKTANPASLRRLMILSNYAGNPLTPFTYSGEGAVTARNTLYATTIYENGTSLSNKYLGKTAKAADADKLDGNDSTYYLNYNNLTNKPTIPTVNNATLTIQKNGTTVNSFTANASSNVTANITVPTKTSDITNDSGFLTSHQSIKTLKTDNTTAQSTSSSEAIAGSGTINLHKVAKTGTYSDLIGTPTIPTTYLASASVSSNTLTLTPASGTATTFTPYNQTVAANSISFPANKTINFIGKDGITVEADGSTVNQINVSGAGVPPEIIDISDGLTQTIKNKVAAKPLSFLQDSNGYLYYPSYFSSSDGIPVTYESFDTESCESKALSIDWTNLTVDTSSVYYAEVADVQNKTYIHNLTITPTSTSQAHTLYLKIINRTSTALTKASLLVASKSNSLQPRAIECGILNSSSNFYPARLVSTSYSGAAPTFTILVNGQSNTWTLTLSTVTDDFVQL